MASSQNPYYGRSSCPHSQVRPPVSELLVRKIELCAFSRVRWYPIWVCQTIAALHAQKVLNHTLGIGMTQEQLEESLPWKIGW